jgi:hypothetical protein
MPDEMLPYLPAFDYVLIDLSTIDEKLPSLQSDYGRLTGLLLQYSCQKRAIERVLLEAAQLLRDVVDSETGRTSIGTTVIYLSWASPLTAIEIVGFLNKSQPKQPRQP